MSVRAPCRAARAAGGSSRAACGACRRAAARTCRACSCRCDVRRPYARAAFLGAQGSGPRSGRQLTDNKPCPTGKQAQPSSRLTVELHGLGQALVNRAAGIDGVQLAEAAVCQPGQRRLPVTPPHISRRPLLALTQVYWNYTTSLPIAAMRVPTFTTTASNISYPSLTSGGIMNLAGGAQTNFAVRFVGASLRHMTMSSCSFYAN